MVCSLHPLDSDCVDSGARAIVWAVQMADRNSLTRTRDGDGEAFGEFYDDTATELLGWFRYRTASEDTAADLTAETFSEALRSLDAYDTQRGSPVQWLYGIARHQLHHWWRAERVRRTAREQLHIHLDVPHEDDTDLVELRADLESAIGPLTQALAELSEPLREAVAARVLKQRSYTQVAEELGCSTGAARVRVSRGLAQMQSHLKAAGVNIG